MRPFFNPIGQKSLFVMRQGRRSGATEAVFCLLCMCNIRRFYCESCTRPISTNPGSTEAGEYGLTRGRCSVARRLEGVTVAGCCGFRGVFWVRLDFVVFLSFFSSNAHALHSASMRPPCLIYLYVRTRIEVMNFTINVFRYKICTNIF